MHVITIIILALVFLPGLWVKWTLKRHSKDLQHIPGTGEELVTHLCEKYGLEVELEETDQGDHYDPESKTIRLSKSNLEGKSLTAVATAAHEFGHAVQDASNDSILELRTRLAKKIPRIAAFGTGLLIIAPALVVLSRSPALGIFIMAGFLLTVMATALIHIITLPVEWDASFGKALPILESGNYLSEKDLETVRTILTACALTYVAQSVLSVLSIRNLFAVLKR